MSERAVVENQRQQTGEQGEQEDPRRRVDPDGERGRRDTADGEQGHQADGEAQRGEVGEPQLGTGGPAEHGAGGPEGGGADGQGGSLGTGHADAHRVGEGQQPRTEDGRQGEDGVAAAQPLPQHQRCEGDGDERLELLQHLRRDGVAEPERRGEQRRGEGRGARADDEHAHLGARAGGEDPAHGRHDPRADEHDEDEVLPEDDGQGRVFLGERAPPQGRQTPERGRERDEPGAVGSTASSHAAQHPSSIAVSAEVVAGAATSALIAERGRNNLPTDGAPLGRS